MSENPLGREIVWDYIRINFKDISDEYGEDDPRLGRMLLDVVKTFENEFLFYELLEFVFFTSTGATANARFRALEIVSTNFIWLTDKEEEIMEAFGGGRKRSFKRTICSVNNRVRLFKKLNKNSKSVYQKVNKTMVFSKI